MRNGMYCEVHEYRKPASNEEVGKKTKREMYKLAGWQSGHAAACKAAYVGSIPALASKKICS